MSSLKNYKVDLKSKYNRYIKLSVIITLILIIAGFKFSPKNTKPEKLKSQEQEIIFVNVIPTNQKSKPPEFPKPLIPVISMEENIEDIELDNVEIDLTKNLTSPPEIIKEKIIEPETFPFQKVEFKPELIGGMKSIQNKLYYPEIIKRAGIQGKVLIGFIVDKNGDVESVEVIKSVNEQLDEIALNAVKELKFIPGKQRGKPVKVKMTIPIEFRLN